MYLQRRISANIVRSGATVFFASFSNIIKHVIGSARIVSQTQLLYLRNQPHTCRQLHRIAPEPHIDSLSNLISSQFTVRYTSFTASHCHSFSESHTLLSHLSTFDHEPQQTTISLPCYLGRGRPRPTPAGWNGRNCCCHHRVIHSPYRCCEGEILSRSFQVTELKTISYQC